jgi:lipopolysaccharide transport system ATP-binding protein
MPRTILAENLSKVYQLGERSQSTMLREVVAGAFKRKNAVEKRTLWALKNLSFEIQQGELVGIIGRNGAGKSTLLKILSRITCPTSGRMQVDGRVASLLEVGSGFHDELTGRENIYMNGSILGMKKREIDQTMDAIVAFADLGKFLDTPIKRYSSGMRMRLGFSVAAHLSPDVMFVDEVLAVGDVGFQRKCLGAIRDLGQSGRTVLFVSHNLAAVENLCRRAIWISDGEVKKDGDSREVIRAYLSSMGTSDKTGLDLTTIKQRKGTGAARLTRLQILDINGEPRRVIHSGDSVTFRLHYECKRPVPNLLFGVRIYSSLGTLITETNTYSTGLEMEASPRRGYVDVDIDFLNLMPSSYHISIWTATVFEWHDLLDNVTALEVEASDYYGTGRGIESRFGLMFLPCRWKRGEGEEPFDGSNVADLEQRPVLQ